VGCFCWRAGRHDHAAELSDEKRKQLFLKSREKNAHRRLAHPGSISHFRATNPSQPNIHGEEEKVPPNPNRPGARGNPERTPRATPTETPEAPAHPLRVDFRRTTSSLPRPNLHHYTLLRLQRARRSPPKSVIKKSGYQKPRGFSLPFHLFGKRYTYLTSSVRRRLITPRSARALALLSSCTNSGTKQGNARIFDYYHRKRPANEQRPRLSFRHR
jgi:hypothetical protein